MAGIGVLGMTKVNRVRKRRRKTRREAPPRLDERLSALGSGLDRALETPVPIPEEPVLRHEAPAVGAPGREPAPERPSRRDLDVPEAEVVIIRRERVSPAQRGRQPAAEAPRAPTAPPSAEPLRKPRPADAVDGTPRAAFDGLVEEASVIIIRRPPRAPTP
jgi:hypothetical protein